MTDKISRQRALEILSNPYAKERDWIGALAILDGKIPSNNSGLQKKVTRFARRVFGLSLAYFCVFSAWGFLLQSVSGAFAYDPMVLLSGSIIWAVLEASAGLFTLMALYVMMTHLPSILSLNMIYQTTWMVVLINCVAYAKFNWRPYILVPLRKLSEHRPTKLIR